MSLSPRHALFVLIAVPLAFSGCNCGDNPLDPIPNPEPVFDSGVRHDAGVDGGVDGGSGLDAGSVFQLLGVWTVSGTDTRGAYTGQVELRLASTIDAGVIDGGFPEGGADAGVDAGVAAVRFIRVIHYNSPIVVEDGRDLYWAWEGVGRDVVSLGAELGTTLAVRDFITQRDALKRTIFDVPVQVTGRVLVGNGFVKAAYTGAGITADEQWTNRQVSGVNPIFMSNRQTSATNAEPSASTKQAYGLAFGTTYWTLAGVTPFVSRPEFQRMVHGAVIDATDFDFYRTNPNSLRVVNKIIDPISLQETLQRANAYRQTLATKGSIAANDTYGRFVQPSGVAMVPDSISASNTITYSGDSALWTAMYMAGEAYRFEATADASALTHVAASLDSLMKLQEITGDWTKFARALRPGTGALEAGWKQGTGDFASLQYLEGGNNDMMKGLQYGYVIGWTRLCKSSSAATYAALCTRLKGNIDHLTDIDLGALQNASNGQVNHWLRTVIRANVLSEIVTYGKQLLLAEAYGLATYAAGQFVDNVQSGPVLYIDGVSDFSGLHLNYVDLIVRAELSQLQELQVYDLNSGNTVGTIAATQAEIIATHDLLRKEHMPLYHVLAGVYANQDFTPADQDDLRWALRSFRVPKTPILVDHSMNPSWSVSPFPNVPWKADWAQAGVDRRGSLTWLPNYELPSDVYEWKNGRRFMGGDGSESSTVDYLHLYWFARKANLIGAAE